MIGLGQTALCVICASVIAGITASMLSDSFSKDLIRLLSGVFITVALLTQMQKLDFDFLQEPYFQSVAEGHRQTHEGMTQAKNQLTAVIKESCETYILDKAKSLGADIQADIGLSASDIPVPETVTLWGSVTQEQKEILQEILIQQMGIQKEDQLWNGEIQGSGEGNF